MLTPWINSAALDLVDTSLDLYTAHFDRNMQGPIFLTKEALPYLPRGGRIVFISSAAARLGVAGHVIVHVE